MQCFANLNELRRHLPRMTDVKGQWLCTHLESWLEDPCLTATYLFESDDEPEWVRDVCGRLGLNSFLPVECALECLREAPEEQAEALKIYAALYWLK